ncbi:hypothetical protein LA345_39585 (plasmid) [Burkholderia vietnamiensis]|nr:hypothetical protein [Burkholderia vietnamiensis]
MLTQIGIFFTKGRRVRLRVRPCDRAVPVWRVVTEHHWLNDKQFVDAVAVAMIKPGPVVINGRLHRVSGRGLFGRARCRARHVSCLAICSP